MGSVLFRVVEVVVGGVVVGGVVVVVGVARLVSRLMVYISGRNM